MMRHHTSRGAAGVALLVAVLLTAGCAGPKQDLDVGVSEVASDIVLGAPGKVPAPALAPVPLPPNGLPVALPPTVVGLPQPPPLPEPVPFVPPVTCPSAPPLSVPKLVAPNDVTLPPAAAT